MSDYLRGRSDEHTATIYVLEKMRVLGFVNVDTANVIIDHLNKIDRTER